MKNMVIIKFSIARRSFVEAGHVPKGRTICGREVWGIG
jgi:hypothetical protein